MACLAGVDFVEGVRRLGLEIREAVLDESCLVERMLDLKMERAGEAIFIVANPRLAVRLLCSNPFYNV